MLSKICVIQHATQETRAIKIDHAGYTASARQHEQPVDHTDQASVCLEILD